jgi:hypothetical protein
MSDARIPEIRPFVLKVDDAAPQRRRSVVPREKMPVVQCAFCDSADTEPTSIYGCHMMTAQYFCRSCRSTFDWVREEWQVEA